MPTSQSKLKKQLDDLLAKYDVEIAKAFRKSISDIVSTIKLKELVTELQGGDVDAAMSTLNIDPAAFTPLSNSISAAYHAGGLYGVSDFPVNVVFFFNPGSPRSEAWLKDHSSTLISDIVDDQRTSIRAALTEALSVGQNPNRTALDIVGRINKATNVREGGLLGLTSVQSQYVQSAEDELRSGDPKLLRNYLSRTARDKRYDNTVLKAIDSEKPLPQSTVDLMVNRYSNTLLRIRGEMIGRTETLSSINAASHEAFRQGLDKTKYKENDVVKTWDSVGDGRVRHTHQVLNGKKVAGLETPFHSPSGALMRYPGDRSLGAGAAEVIACRCGVKRRIDFFGEMRANVQ